MMELDNNNLEKKIKTVLITGASRGLGRSLTHVFADNNYNLILHSKTNDIPEIKTLDYRNGRKELTGVKVPYELIKGDIKETHTIYKLTKIAEELGGIDVLINNAGEHRQGGIEEVDSLEFSHLMKVNLLAPMILTQALWKQVKKKKGLIIFINSIAGKVGTEGEFSYCASKHGLKGFADSIQFDAIKAGVKVLSVYLGAMKTDMSKGRKNYDQLMDPNEVASFIYDIAKNYRTLRITEMDICRRLY